jgi:hypothetical protein
MLPSLRLQHVRFASLGTLTYRFRAPLIHLFLALAPACSGNDKTGQESVVETLPQSPTSHSCFDLLKCELHMSPSRYSLFT